MSRFEGNGYRAAYGPAGSDGQWRAVRSIEPISTLSAPVSNTSKLYPLGCAATAAATFSTEAEARAWATAFTGETKES